MSLVVEPLSWSNSKTSICSHPNQPTRAAILQRQSRIFAGDTANLRNKETGMKRIALFSLSMLVLLAVALPLAAQKTDGSHIFAYPPIRIVDVQQDSTTPHGYFPAQMRAAYGFNGVPNGGAGQIIGIVDAFDNPNAEADLQVYDAQFNLPTCTTGNGCFTKIKVGNPLGDTGWGLEIALDIQQAHSLAPAAKVILVEANSNSFDDLLVAV